MSERTDTMGQAGSARSVVPLVYNGTLIHERHEMLSLTDMWRAARSPDAKRPSDWLALSSTGEFRSAVEATLDAGKSGIQTSKGGRGVGGSTFGHWQIALAYAKYLSPEFHMWCNEVVRQRMEGQPALALPPDVAELIARTNGICRMMIGKVTEIEKSLPDLANRIALEMAPAMLQAFAASQNFAIRRGMTAGQIWRAHGFPPIRVTCWFSNRLREMGCAIEGGGFGELGLTKARLFDPDKADVWLKNGGRLIVENKIAERRGQGVLKLVPKAGDQPQATAPS